MITREALKAYYKKLLIEGIIKSIILGLAAGFLVAGLFCLPAWGAGGWWLIGVASGLGLATAATVCTLLFIYRYKPSFKQTAARLDRSGGGLDERVITMLELEGDDSFIAHKQREDSKDKIKSITPRMMEFRLPIFSIISLAATFIFSVTMLTGTSIQTNNRVNEPPFQTNITLPVEEDNGNSGGIGGFDERINGQIQKLYDTVDRYEGLIPDEVMQQLYEIISRFEDAVWATNDNVRRGALFNLAYNEIRVVIEQALEDIAEELEEVLDEIEELLDELAELEAIENPTQDILDRIDEIMDRLEELYEQQEMLEEQQDALEEMQDEFEVIFEDWWEIWLEAGEGAVEEDDLLADNTQPTPGADPEAGDGESDFSPNPDGTLLGAIINDGATYYEDQWNQIYQEFQELMANPHIPDHVKQEYQAFINQIRP